MEQKVKRGGAESSKGWGRKLRGAGQEVKRSGAGS